jgi:hypothetical protein
MWRRAVEWDVSEGGRFEVRTCRTLSIWAGARDGTAVGQDAQPIGLVSVRWHAPAEDRATICRLSWRPTDGGSEELVWQALQTLAGVSSERLC